MDDINGATKERQRPRRGVWIWDSDEYLQGNADSLFDSINETLLTDAYIYIAPRKWTGLRDALVKFNRHAYRSQVRVWAVDGDQTYIGDVDAGERFMDGLRALIEFNSTTALEEHFHGFQAFIDLEDSATQKGRFQNGLATSQLDEDQRTQRDIVLHQWLNIHTRASACIRSYEMPFSAAMPYWLMSYEGEPVNMRWANGAKNFRCIIELIMPLLDEYVVLNCHTDPAQIASRTSDALRYASKQLENGHETPRVMASIGPLFHGPHRHDLVDGSSASSRDVVLKDMVATELLMNEYDAFGGMIIHDFTAWKSLPQSTAMTSGSHTRAPVMKQGTFSSDPSPEPTLEARFNTVIDGLQNLNRPS